jgi:hypothetical protein
MRGRPDVDPAGSTRRLAFSRILSGGVKFSLTSSKSFGGVDQVKQYAAPEIVSFGTSLLA